MKRYSSHRTRSRSLKRCSKTKLRKTVGRHSRRFASCFALKTVMTQSPLSRIAKRTRGQSHGPITRLMSPSDFGRLLKPFVFLDLIDDHEKPFSGFGLHPHSGIATVTYIAEGSVRYEDTNGATGLLPAGGVEWMQAGGGV